MLRNALCCFVAAILLASTAAAQQNIVVVLDDSGSMNGSRIRDAKAALVEVINTLPADTQLAVYALNMGWVYPDNTGTVTTINREDAAAAVNSVYPSGGTPLGAAIKVGADALLKLRKQYHYGTYRLLVVTDGEATDGNLAYKYLPDIARRNITVDLIGLDMSSQHSLAAAINGSYKEVNDAKSLAKAVQDVLAESSGSSDDADDSDYSLLQGVPTEFASAALNALAKMDDDVSIGTKPLVQVKMDEKGDVVVDEEGNVATEPLEDHRSQAVLFLALLILGGTVMVGAFIFILATLS